MLFQPPSSYSTVAQWKTLKLPTYNKPWHIENKSMHYLENPVSSVYKCVNPTMTGAVRCLPPNATKHTVLLQYPRLQSCSNKPEIKVLIIKTPSIYTYKAYTLYVYTHMYILCFVCANTWFLNNKKPKWSLQIYVGTEFLCLQCAKSMESKKLLIEKKLYTIYMELSSGPEKIHLNVAKF
jgi:hypothetical protein